MDANRIAALLADTLILYLYIDVDCNVGVPFQHQHQLQRFFCVAVKRIRKDLPVEVSTCLKECTCLQKCTLVNKDNIQKGNSKCYLELLERWSTTHNWNAFVADAGVA